MRGWRRSLLIFFVLTILVRLEATAQTGCDASLPTLYQQVAPSVVFISAVSIGSMPSGDRISTVVGSGVLIDAEGLDPDQLTRRLWAPCDFCDTGQRLYNPSQTARRRSHPGCGGPPHCGP